MELVKSADTPPLWVRISAGGDLLVMTVDTFWAETTGPDWPLPTALPEIAGMQYEPWWP